MPGIDEAAALASIAGSLGGGKQLGGIAPPFQPGGGVQGNFLEDLVKQLGLPSASALSMLAGQNNFQPLEAAVTPPASALLGPSQAPDPLMGAGGVGPAQVQPQEQGGLLGGLGDKFGGFFGNLDENLQSPSKIIGLGLLNRLDPRLGLAGLLGGGLLGKNKVF